MAAKKTVAKTKKKAVRKKPPVKTETGRGGDTRGTMLCPACKKNRMMLDDQYCRVCSAVFLPTIDLGYKALGAMIHYVTDALVKDMPRLWKHRQESLAQYLEETQGTDKKVSGHKFTFSIAGEIVPIEGDPLTVEINVQESHSRKFKTPVQGGLVSAHPELFDSRLLDEEGK